MASADLNDSGGRPLWPRAAASAAVLRGDAVLLVERGKGAAAGLWSLPGGHIEPGETAAAAALREVAEETGVAADVVALAGVHDVILRSDGGELRAHYVLAVYAARWRAGEARALTEVRDARFVRLADLGVYRLTDGAQGLIARAAELVGGCRPLAASSRLS